MRRALLLFTVLLAAGCSGRKAAPTSSRAAVTPDPQAVAASPSSDFDESLRFLREGPSKPKPLTQQMADSICSTGVDLGCAARAHADGVTRFQRGDYRGAINYFSAAVAAAPTNPKYHYNLGSALARAGAIDQAATEWRETLRLDPTYREARTSLQWASDTLEAQRAERVAEELHRQPY
jgi:tetratricopeptide (TPR) repeat protein